MAESSYSTIICLWMFVFQLKSGSISISISVAHSHNLCIWTKPKKIGTIVLFLFSGRSIILIEFVFFFYFVGCARNECTSPRMAEKREIIEDSSHKFSFTGSERVFFSFIFITQNSSSSWFRVKCTSQRSFDSEL